MVQQAESTIGIEEALLLAQSEFPEIPKDATNTYYNTRYATLDAIVSATRPALTKHELLANHKVEDTEHGVKVTAILRHLPSKQELSNTLSCDCVRSDPQKMGLAITYLRRYTLAPLLGVTPDEDDDGNAAKPADGSNGRTSGKQQAQQRSTGRQQTQRQQEPARGRGRSTGKQQAQPIEEFKLPEGWPQCDQEKLLAWIGDLKVAAHFQAALGMFMNEPEVYLDLQRWGELCRALHTAYHMRLSHADAKRRAEVEPITRTIDEALSKLELDEDAENAFDQKEPAGTAGTNTEAPKQ